MPPDDYQSERYNPTLPYCGGIKLWFDGKELSMFGVTDKVCLNYSYKAVSGKPDAKGNFDYSVEAQKKGFRGPIPEGTYWIRPDEFWENSWYKRGSYSAWGNYRITIHPFTTTQTYGRGGFFIHGGDVPGSAGCIDLTGAIDQFYRDINCLVGMSSTCQIHLTVKYK
jgi:hypothetical protein